MARGQGGFQTRPYGERGVAINCHSNHYGLVRGAQGEESGDRVLSQGLGGFQTRPYGERGVAIYCHRNHYGLERGAQGDESGDRVLFEGWAGFKPAPTARGALLSTVIAITMGL